MQTHVVQLTKQRLSDFFVKEEGMWRIRMP